jgi:hypothetical protein
LKTQNRKIGQAEYNSLDVGCGSKPKGDVNVDFFGVGFNPQTGNQQEGDFMAPRLIRNFVMAEATHLPFCDNSFNIVLSYHTIEHVPEPFKMYRELCRVAKRKVIVRCPHRLGSGAKMPYHLNYFDEGWFKKAADHLGLASNQFVTAYDYPFSSKLEKTVLHKARNTLPWRAFKHFERKRLMRKIHVPWEVEAWTRKQNLPANDGNIRFVVVYNIPWIYEAVFSSSSFIQKTSVSSYNNINHEPLPVFYNKTIEQYLDEDVWLVFCHQDFILNENLSARLKGRDTQAIYGPIGVRVAAKELTGRIMQKDGSTIGQVISKDEPVQTLDEQCLIAHSSLFREGLRFDEQFAFHFYGADICMQAYTKGFDVIAMQLACQHKSRTIHGDVKTPDYLATRELFKQKWAQLLPIRTTTTTIHPDNP